MTDPHMTRTDWLNDERCDPDDSDYLRQAHGIVTSLLAIGPAVSMSEMRTAAHKLYKLASCADTQKAADSIEHAEDCIRDSIDRALEAYRTCRPYSMADDMRDDLEMALEDLEVRE